ncbi:MAG: asparagine synthase (glutamine-hydrolyzing) [Acidimicrobiales bacterium]
MCGIAGVIDLERSMGRIGLRSAVDRMTDALAHRGPDDSGAWIDAGAGIGIGHRRLAVLDTSARAHQPMTSRSGRYVISYNGEFYNFRECRAELAREGSAFAGTGDTEVLLEAIDRWGVDRTLERVDGMFAFAVWDARERRLSLARDRFGEKPLAWSQMGPLVYFASEVRSIRAALGCAPSLNRGAIALFLRLGYIPAPYTVYSGVNKVVPGTVVSMDCTDGTCTSRAYWSAGDVARAGSEGPSAASDAELVEALDGRLRAAVSRRLVSDVPLGAFLSGGVDSSVVVSMMQQVCTEPVRTFTIGFDEHRFDEAPAAARVAAHLGTDHTELYVSSAEARAVIPHLAEVYDEPFADSSQIPTYLVSQLARRTVTVSLSGDGGDELFGGYNRHVWGRRVQRLRSRTPTRVQRTMASLMRSRSAARWDEWLGAFPLRGTIGTHVTGEQVHKLAGALAGDDTTTLYMNLVSLWDDPSRVARGAAEPPTYLSTGATHPLISDAANMMMYLDTVVYLPGDILVKLDRASMAHSLETRMPFLDPDLFVFAWRLPSRLRSGPDTAGNGKVLLRRVLSRYVPAGLREGPKRGFAVPLGNWLKGPLRPWAEDLLSTQAIDGFGVVDRELVRAAWTAHLAGAGSHHHQLWAVLMLHSWLAENP